VSAPCPFCGLDPFHYVDIGVGMQAVAVNCCDLGCDLYSRQKTQRQFASRVLRDMRNPSPRAKARAMRALREAGLRA
jgi:hypothetical protein